MKPRKVLVTGATGFIGSRLCEILSLDAKLPYRALVRNFARAARIARLDAELVAGEMLDRKSLERAVEGCDAVINLAHADDNKAGQQTEQLVTACAKAKVKRLVHVSSMAVHGPSPSAATIDERSPIERWNEPYSDAKAAAEALVMAAGKRGAFEAVALRPTIVYGPFSFFVTPIIADARKGVISLVDGGRGVCNAVYVDDVCDAILAALANDQVVGEVFMVNGDTRLTWRDFITTFAEMVPGDKAIHDFSLAEIDEHWKGRRPGALDSIRSVIRLAASPAFHAQLSTIPPVGSLIRGAKELMSSAISEQQKTAIKTRLQGARAGTAPPDTPPVPMPGPGRVVREAYRAWVVNDLAKRRLGVAPAHDFARGAARTRAWLEFARMI